MSLKNWNYLPGAGALHRVKEGDIFFDFQPMVVRFSMLTLVAFGSGMAFIKYSEGQWLE